MRESQTRKIPFTLILGNNERDENTISYRLHGKEETKTLPKEEFIKYLKEVIDNKTLNKDLI